MTPTTPLRAFLKEQVAAVREAEEALQCPCNPCRNKNPLGCARIRHDMDVLILIDHYEAGADWQPAGMRRGA